MTGNFSQCPLCPFTSVDGEAFNAHMRDHTPAEVVEISPATRGVWIFQVPPDGSVCTLVAHTDGPVPDSVGADLRAFVADHAPGLYLIVTTAPELRILAVDVLPVAKGEPGQDAPSVLPVHTQNPDLPPAA